MLDQAFDALKTYDWGVDPKTLESIDEAVTTSHGDADARAKLEARLVPVLQGDAPRAAKDYVCRKLRTIGSASSVVALSALLTDADLSHMARFALERIPEPDAGGALRGALGKASGPQKVGIIGSLGVRGEGASVEPLKALLVDQDPEVVTAAAEALGAIGSLEAARALLTTKATAAAKPAITDACLACAERLLAAGKKREARLTYERLLAGKPADAVRSAATRGMQACQ